MAALLVTEIFHSIQGESTWAGCPCVFVRLRGCHLRCAYCDTAYAFSEGGRRDLEDIVAEVRSYPANLVEITGGEPLLQRETPLLIRRLCDLGRTVLVETSGACDIGACDPRSIRIMDVKTPGSGEESRNDLANIGRLTRRDEVKFVIVDREDYQWSRDFIKRHELPRRCGAVLMSPVFEQPAGPEVAGRSGLDPALLAAWILEDGLPVRLQLQVHKLIWHPQARGV